MWRSGPARRLLGDRTRAGAVNVLHGTDGGLTGSGSTLITQSGPEVHSEPEPDDRFGAALAATRPSPT